MPERRRSPRVKCRLQCTIRKGDERIRARILDVSEGGFCLLSPVVFDREEKITLGIEIPTRGPVMVEAVAWHVRSAKKSIISRQPKTWVVGAMLTKAEEGYERLLPDSSGLALSDDSPDSIIHAANDTLDGPIDDDVDDLALRVYRVRIKANDSPRTRTLSLASANREEARSLAEADLGSAWTILEVKPK